MNEIEKMIGKEVTGIGNCGMAKDKEVTGILRCDNFHGYTINVIKENGFELPCSVYTKSIKLK